MKFLYSKERDGWLFRWFKGHYGPEVAYVSLRKLSYSPGLGLYLELPTVWHKEEDRGESRASVSLIFLWITFHFTFPWFKTYPDHMQCSGPRYGFQFWEDILWLYWGQSDGTVKNRGGTSYYMPWSWKYWKSKEVIYKDKTESYPYVYKLKSGKFQHRTATIHKEHREWYRFWYPWHKVSDAISVEFDDEVGERSGSWKGGTIGCGYEMKPGESMFMTLRRMEREREF